MEDVAEDAPPFLPGGFRFAEEPVLPLFELEPLLLLELEPFIGKMDEQVGPLLDGVGEVFFPKLPVIGQGCKSGMGKAPDIGG